MHIYYDGTNPEDIKGTTFIYHNDDDGVDDLVNFGKTYMCFIPAIDINIGYTIKALEDDDPDSYEWCFDLSNEPTEEEIKQSIYDINVLMDLIRVKGVVKWSDFSRCTITKWALEAGGGSCPF